MNRQTAELVNALSAVTKHVPRVATELLAGTLTVAKQQEFAGLLIELGELFREHAEDQAAGIIQLPAAYQMSSHRPDDDSLGNRRPGNCRARRRGDRVPSGPQTTAHET